MPPPARKTTRKTPAGSTTIEAKGMRLTKLDADGQPTGDTVDIPDLAADERVRFPDRLPGEFFPLPTAVGWSVWPADVRLPSGIRHGVAKVFATPQGLYVYAKRDKDPTALVFYAPIKYDETPKPEAGYVARDAGNKIVTSQGVVTVVSSTGCGCAFGTLKRFVPPWSRRRISWGALSA
jgi:hypothetical protein